MRPIGCQYVGGLGSPTHASRAEPSPFKGMTLQDPTFPHSEATAQAAELVVHSPITILGAGRVDPFGSYPIKTQAYMHGAMDYCEYSSLLVSFCKPTIKVSLNIWLTPLWFRILEDHLLSMCWMMISS